MGLADSAGWRDEETKSQAHSWHLGLPFLNRSRHSGAIRWDVARGEWGRTHFPISCGIQSGRRIRKSGHGTSGRVADFYGYVLAQGRESSLDLFRLRSVLRSFRDVPEMK